MIDKCPHCGASPEGVKRYKCGSSAINAEQSPGCRIAELEAENTHLRAALAMSQSPCTYCQLPREEMAKCRSGFPGCARADDMTGCPEFGAALDYAKMVEQAQNTITELEAEVGRLSGALYEWNRQVCEQMYGTKFAEIEAEVERLRNGYAELQHAIDQANLGRRGIRKDEVQSVINEHCGLLRLPPKERT
jgi:uncharacterized protein YukE